VFKITKVEARKGTREFWSNGTRGVFLINKSVKYPKIPYSNIPVFQ
jgi:hypothetical protein